jgi:molybdopterin molybdotransferase
MLTEHEALERILDQVQPLGAESLPLRRAGGRCSAVDLSATVPSPPFDNSAMDGFALAFTGDEAPTGARFRVVGAQPAGPDLGLSLREGEAARIFTGAPLPAGTAAVLMQEDARAEGDTVEVTESCACDEFIRRAGADLCRGQHILSRGDVLTPQRVGLLASQGLATVDVHQSPCVAILSSGDELIPPGQPLAAGQIYESNGVLLAALVEASGAGVATVTTVRDEPSALAGAMCTALAEADVLVLSGGVSVVAASSTKPALATLGVEVDFWRVAIKPGKPFVFGRAPGGALVFGLPGNPVSSFVTFLLFVRPALRRLMGAVEIAPAWWPARAGAALSNRDARPHYIRGRMERGVFMPQGRQESHALYGLSRSDALVRLEPGAEIAAGAAVEVMPC